LNVTSKTDAANHTTSFTYDASGNPLTVTNVLGTTTLTYNSFGDVLTVTDPMNGVMANTYDAHGKLLTTKDVLNNTTTFTYNTLRELLTAKDALNHVTTLTWNTSGQTVDYLNGLGIDDKLRQTSSSATLYFSQDHLGSTRALTDSSGNVVESVSYDSFGNGASTLSRYGYTGREWDADANLYYYRNRWYDPQEGRFISEDPIGLEGGINSYAYVGNSPVNSIDPTGLDGWGNDLANWLDEKIEYARQYYQSDVQNWGWNGAVNTIADLSHGASNLFRVGSGLGHAIYDEDDNGYGRAANIATDIARASGLFTLLGGGAAKFTKACPVGAGGTPTIPRFLVTEDGVAVPAEAGELKSNMQLLQETSTNPATSRKFIGIDSQGPARVRIEQGHPSTPGYTGPIDPLHAVDHLHIDRRLNGATGPWRSKEKIPYAWPF
jgi:RHS repeat-associated protein